MRLTADEVGVERQHAPSVARQAVHGRAAHGAGGAQHGHGASREDFEEPWATIQLVTEVPGPRSRALWARREAAVPRGPYNATPIFVKEGRGAVLTDVDGNRLLDFAGGIGCMNVGHANEAVVRAAAAQAAALTHGCFHVTPYEGYVEAAERMNALVPGDFPKKTLFVNSGAEAVENAVKIARAATGRPAVIAFEDGFHGRTLLALTPDLEGVTLQGTASGRSRPRSTACPTPTATAARTT